MDMRKPQAEHNDLHSNKEDRKRLKTKEDHRQFTLGFRLRVFLWLANKRDVDIMSQHKKTKVGISF